MQYHIKGKRHQKAVEYWNRKKEAAKLSIFVRNFPIGTSEQELWQYFAQFGRVTKVSIVKPNVRTSQCFFDQIIGETNKLLMVDHTLYFTGKLNEYM